MGGKMGIAALDTDADTDNEEEEEDGNDDGDSMGVSSGGDSFGSSSSDSGYYSTTGDEVMSGMGIAVFEEEDYDASTTEEEANNQVDESQLEEIGEYDTKNDAQSNNEKNVDGVHGSGSGQSDATMVEDGPFDDWVFAMFGAAALLLVGGFVFALYRRWQPKTHTAVAVDDEEEDEEEEDVEGGDVEKGLVHSTGYGGVQMEETDEVGILG